MDDRPPPAPPQGYDALRHGCAWFPLTGCAVVRIDGPDAVAFVDAFTTAHVASLAPSAACEGMLLDARGHVLALVHLLRDASGVWIVAFAGGRTDIASHLERYHIRERLVIEDLSAQSVVVGIAGAAAEAAVAGHLADGMKTIAAGGVWPGGVLVVGSGETAGAVEGRLAAAGIPRASADAVDLVRIEEAYPLPRDIPERALPQELGRDARAISFRKGCYLGQETVARLDALGHVNRRLVLLECPGGVPEAGAAVVQRGAAVAAGTVTSARWSPGRRAGLALATVAVAALAAGTELVAGDHPVAAVHVPPMPHDA